jgi:hypothetical protein
MEMINMAAREHPGSEASWLHSKLVLADGVPEIKCLAKDKGPRAKYYRAILIPQSVSAFTTKLDYNKQV